MDPSSELDFLYRQLALINERIKFLLTQENADDVTWRGHARYEQRCYRCGDWIRIGQEIAAVNLLGPSGTIVARYLHEECVDGQ